MSQVGIDLALDGKRNTLWLVLALNVAIAVGFFVTAYLGDSNALLANGVDNLSDAVVYALSLLALTRSRTWKRGAARLSGLMLLLFALGVMADAVQRYSNGSSPGGVHMIAMALVAAAVNLWCLRLLRSLRQKDVNLRAAATFSFNDFVSNGGIVVAGLAVLFTGANWPDLVVGIAVACIAIYGGVKILRDAHGDTHAERADGTRGTS